MRNFISNDFARVGFITMVTGSLALAQDAPQQGAKGVTAAPISAEQTKTDSSYALGYRTGGNFVENFGRYGVKISDLQMDDFTKGFQAAVKGNKPELEDARLQAAMTALGDLIQQREKDLAQMNLDTGKKFLAENGKREGVVTTKSGLQYEILKKGGDTKYIAPKEGSPEKQLMVNYKGSLIDGSQFDASPEGSPVPITLKVISGMNGLKEALTMIPVGAKWKIFIPSELAYGAERLNSQIAPNTTLIFDLELIEIKDAPPAPPSEGAFPIPLPQGK